MKSGTVPRRGTQRGQGLLIVLAVLGIGLSAVFYTLLTPASVSIERDKITTAALAQVKDALIGWSVQRTPSVVLPNARPGELPCPDANNDGFEDGTCVAGAIGRVPWKTLGIPEPKDGAGETLWYAISGPYRIWNVNSNPVNSDTKGNMTVNSGNPPTLFTSEAAAVIFAPGEILPGQNRDAANQNTASNYLEAAPGGNNASIGGSFIASPRTSTFNDRLLVITSADVMTSVEKRAAREILNLLADYRSGSTCNCYPWADNNFNGTSNSPNRFGGIPLASASPQSWSSALGYSPPSWFADNQWYKMIYYAVSKRDADGGDSDDPRFTVDATADVKVVLITTGPAVAGDGRPANNWSNYVDDLENRDGTNDFCKPGPFASAPCTPTSAYARDRLYFIP